MQKKQAKPDNISVQRVTELTAMLNRYRHEYYKVRCGKSNTLFRS